MALTKHKGGKSLVTISTDLAVHLLEVRGDIESLGDFAENRFQGALYTIATTVQAAIVNGNTLELAEIMEEYARRKCGEEISLN